MFGLSQAKELRGCGSFLWVLGTGADPSAMFMQEACFPPPNSYVSSNKLPILPPCFLLSTDDLALHLTEKHRITGGKNLVLLPLSLENLHLHPYPTLLLSPWGMDSPTYQGLFTCSLDPTHSRISLSQ